VPLTGSGDYKLEPTVRIVPLLKVGSIRGKLVLPGVGAEIYAIAAPDTLASAMPESDGEFKLRWPFPGTYDVALHPEPAYRDTAITGVSVQAGMTTELGEAQLTPQ
jgi:hypothetical protein